MSKKIYKAPPNVEGKRNNAEEGLDYVDQIKAYIEKSIKRIKEQQRKYDRNEWQRYYFEHIHTPEKNRELNISQWMSEKEIEERKAALEWEKILDTAKIYHIDNEFLISLEYYRETSADFKTTYTGKDVLNRAFKLSKDPKRDDIVNKWKDRNKGVYRDLYESSLMGRSHDMVEKQRDKFEEKLEENLERVVLDR